MKRIIAFSLIILSVSIILASCNKKSTETVTDNTVSEKTTLQVETTFDKTGKTKKTFYRDSFGEIERILVETFDNNGNCITEANYTADERLEGRTEYEYDKNNNKISVTVYDSAGEIVYSEGNYKYKEIKVDGKSSFLVLSYERYNNDGTIQSVFKYEYDENDDIKSIKSYSEKGKLLTQNDF